MTIDPAAYAAILLVLRYLMSLVAVWLLASFLGRERFIGIWESEGEMSLRLILSTIIAVFSLYMRAANQLTTAESISYLEMSLGLHALGTAKVIATKVTSRPQAPPATIQADKAEVNAETANITAPQA